MDNGRSVTEEPSLHLRVLRVEEIGVNVLTIFCSLSVSPCLSVSVCLCLSLSLPSLSLPLPLSLPVCLPLFLCLCLSVCLLILGLIFCFELFARGLDVKKVLR